MNVNFSAHCMDVDTILVQQEVASMQIWRGEGALLKVGTTK